MKRIIHRSQVSVIAAMLLMQGCVEPDAPVNALVVEGYIAEGEYPVVCLMQTVDPLREGASVADMVVRWGVVRLSDGENTVMLVGGPDKNYFPPYTYTTYELKGKRGVSYTLTAEYDGMTVTARTTVPEAPQIESVSVESDPDDPLLRRLSLSFRPCASGEGEEYFRVMSRVRGEHAQLLPGFMSAAESGGDDGLLTIPVNRPRTFRDTIDYRSSFKAGDEIEVALCAMDRDAFMFWREYDNAVAFGGNQFIIPSAPLRGNVEGGYGYFFGYGICRRYLDIL